MFFVTQSAVGSATQQHLPPTRPTTDERRSEPLTRLSVIALLVLLGVAAWLRWQYIVRVQPYPDEFVTLLAVKMILERGLPVLPSGLFYDHGLLFSYAGAAASALAGLSREAVRAVSLLCGLLVVWLTWRAGRRWFAPAAGLVAAAVVAVVPSAVLWGGRARMYTLLQVWVLLAVTLALAGALDGRRRWRWLALLCLLAAGLTHFVSLALVPPLISGMLAVGWLAARRGSRPWWQRKAPAQAGFDRRVWLEVTGLTAVVLITMVVKRLGQPKSIAPLEGSGAGLLAGIGQVVDIYSALPTDLAAGWQAVARFFTAPEAIWLSALALVAVGWALLSLLRRSPSAPGAPARRDAATFCMAVVIAGTTLEMLLLVAPERRDDKYLFMLLPLLALLAADGLARCAAAFLQVRLITAKTPPLHRVERGLGGEVEHTRLGGEVECTGLGGEVSRQSPAVEALSVLACATVLLAMWPTSAALLERSGPDYDTAFGYVRDQWREGDAVLTGTPAAAAIYLGRNDFYAMQDPGYSYRLLQDGDRLVDRWLGSPWLATDEDLQAVLSAPRRVWLVFERWGLTTEYFSLLTLQRLLAMTDFVREDNGIIVLRSRAGATLIPESPPQVTSVNFADQVLLQGYGVVPAGDIAPVDLEVFLYWQARQRLPRDYTVFVHLRDAEGRTLAQADHLPLAPVYPPTLWPPGETIRERSRLTLPDAMVGGGYTLWVGLYRLDTLERLPVVGDRSGENAAVLPLGDRR